MHELSVTQSILDIVLDKANTANAGKVQRINLVVGALSGIVDDCVQFYFDLLSKDTIAADATLSFQKPETQLRCRNCSSTFTPESDDWTCPDCRGHNIEITTGRELYVESIEVE